ncbi:unnamed protein product [Clavelina lepadiformis]|uniref:Uncharacterized protein n=1 Tax=Clavelina lepadiformis TaxID=159417 RepID=A0ABP0G288_CLALP
MACRSGATWWFRGERCDIFESLAIAVVTAGVVATGLIILFLALLLCLSRRTIAVEAPKSVPWVRKRPDLKARNNACYGLGETVTKKAAHDAITETANNNTTSRPLTQRTSMITQWDSSEIEDDVTSYNMLRPTLPSVHQMVQATSFHSMHSRERAVLSNLHGKMNTEGNNA